MARKAPNHEGHYYTQPPRGKPEWFCWRIKVGGRESGRTIVVKRKTDKLRREAVKEKRQELEAKGYLALGPDLTIKQHLSQWLEHRVKPNRSPKTYTSYEQVCRLYIIPAIGVVRTSKLSSLHIQRLISFVQGAGLSNRTARYAVTILCTGLGKRTRVHLEDVDMPATPDARDRVLSREEILAIIKECGRQEYYKDPAKASQTYFVYGPCRYLIPFLLNSGLRISEALGLLAVDFDRKGQAVSVVKQLYWQKHGKWELRPVKTKAGKRLVPMNRLGMQILNKQLAVLQELKERAGRGYTDYGLLFPTESGRPTNARNVQRTLDTILETLRKGQIKPAAAGALFSIEDNDEPKLNFSHCSLHDCRRSYLTHLASLEPLIQNVMMIAGHTNVQTTMKHYIWAQHKELEKTARKLEFETPSVETKKEETGS